MMDRFQSGTPGRRCVIFPNRQASPRLSALVSPVRHFKGEFTEFPEACKKVLARKLKAKTDGSLERLQGISWSSKRNADQIALHRKLADHDEPAKQMCAFVSSI